MSSAICSNLDQSKILSSGNELKLMAYIVWKLWSKKKNQIKLIKFTKSNNLKNMSSRVMVLKHCSSP